MARLKRSPYISFSLFDIDLCSSVNNMVKFMMRKGIVTDLARIPHSLDLSSPKMAGTVNAALKPLETLSRIMSQPTGSATIAKGKPKPITYSGNKKLGNSLSPE